MGRHILVALQKLRSTWHWQILLVALLVVPFVTTLVVIHRTEAAPCACTLFTTTPSPSAFNNGGALTVGMKFKSDVSGSIGGVRFFKMAAMTGSHSGQLWNANGTLLSSVTFSNESPTGWQQANFATPQAITANTIYTVSVLMNNGRYAGSNNYFATEATNSPLRAPADGAATDNLAHSGQGVFHDGASVSYPFDSFNKSNYWIDVTFFDSAAPTVSSTAPTNGANSVQIGENITATFDQNMSSSSFTSSTFVVKDASNNPVSGTYTYDDSTKTASYIADNGFTTNATYTATLKGGVGTTVKNGGGVALAADYSWSFTTGTVNDCPCSLKNRGGATGSQSFNDGSPLEIGTKIRPSTNGYLTALRFYKPLTSTDTTHTGNVWDTTGTKLGTVSFSNETEYGWQEARFASPLRIYKDTTYVISYGTPSGIYQATSGGLSSTITSGFLSAYANTAAQNAATGSGNNNGVYSTTANTYPGSATNGAATYFWLDAVFSVSPTPTYPLTLKGTVPKNDSYGAFRGNAITASFNRALDGATVTNTSFRLFNATGDQISGTASYDANLGYAKFTPTSSLSYGETYTAKLAATIADQSGTTLGSEQTWSFTVGSSLSTDINAGPGGPLLVITSTSNKYSKYYAEILRTEGLNYFDVKDLSTVTADTLKNYDSAVLAEMALTSDQANMLTSWVTGGGNLVAMRPDSKLASLLGLTAAGSTRTNQYMKVDTTVAPGSGIVSDSMQFKGTADNYSLSGATTVATFYSDANTTTANPAVTTRKIGTKGGSAAAFAYDLAKSVVAQHQGNQAWAGQDRDGSVPIRSNDLFFGNKTGDVQADWVDLNKIDIPQADEQQRLLANVLNDATRDTQPLPRFWYLPFDYKAAVVLAGDDHTLANNIGTEKIDNMWLNESDPTCVLADWTCIRSSHYVYASSALTNARAVQFDKLGFEIADHVGSACTNYSSFSNLSTTYTNSINDWQSNKYTGLPAQQTHRYHCYVWSDWDSQPLVEAANGIRYELNYAAYPGSWIGSRSPIMTGSGMNMRFVDANGDMLDVRQGTTNFDNTATSSTNISAALDNATGSKGYYGIFGTHYDMSGDNFENTVYSLAKSKNVPLISSLQALQWLDAHDSSTFSGFTGANGKFTFTVSAAMGANGLKAMMPTNDFSGTIASIKKGAATVSYQTQSVKGVSYAVFDGAPGTYTVTYTDEGTVPYPDVATDSGSGGSGGSTSTKKKPTPTAVARDEAARGEPVGTDEATGGSDEDTTGSGTKDTDTAADTAKKSFPWLAVVIAISGILLIGGALVYRILLARKRPASWEDTITHPTSHTPTY